MVCQWSVVAVEIKLKNSFVITINANVVPRVTGLIERKQINTELIRKHIEGYELANTLPTKLERYVTKLLVRNDYYADLVSMKQITVCYRL